MPGSHCRDIRFRYKITRRLSMTGAGGSVSEHQPSQAQIPRIAWWIWGEAIPYATQLACSSPKPKAAGQITTH